MKQNIITLIVAIAFFLQAFVPVGFMPAFAGDNMTIEICSGVTGEVINIIDGDEGRSSNNHDNQKTKCPYFNVGSYAQPSLPFIVALAGSFAVSNMLVADDVYIAHLPVSNYKRGPPVTL